MLKLKKKSRSPSLINIDEDFYLVVGVNHFYARTK